jgi:hypothetical protein
VCSSFNPPKHSFHACTRPNPSQQGRLPLQTPHTPTPNSDHKPVYHKLKHTSIPTARTYQQVGSNKPLSNSTRWHAVCCHPPNPLNTSLTHYIHNINHMKIRKGKNGKIVVANSHGSLSSREREPVTESSIAFWRPSFFPRKEARTDST